jgi:uncharacterized DUF497 family protein
MHRKLIELLQECSGFQWDDGNIDKNWLKHEVASYECEQIFLNQPFIVNDDTRHSQTEQRFYALGRTDLGRKLFVVFTIRNKKIRIISARDMNKKESEIYRKL